MLRVDTIEGAILIALSFQVYERENIKRVCVHVFSLNLCLKFTQAKFKCIINYNLQCNEWQFHEERKFKILFFSKIFFAYSIHPLILPLFAQEPARAYTYMHTTQWIVQIFDFTCVNCNIISLVCNGIFPDRYSYFPWQ